MTEAEYSSLFAPFLRRIGWRKRVENREYELRWSLWKPEVRRSRHIPPGVFVLVNPNFFK